MFLLLLLLNCRGSLYSLDIGPCQIYDWQIFLHSLACLFTLGCIWRHVGSNWTHAPLHWKHWSLYHWVTREVLTFSLLIVYFNAQIFNFVIVQFIFIFSCLWFLVQRAKIIAKSNVRELFTFVFSSKSFIVVGLHLDLWSVLS